MRLTGCRYMVRFLLDHQQAYRNEDDDEDNDEDNGNKEPKPLAPIRRDLWVASG